MPLKPHLIQYVVCTVLCYVEKVKGLLRSHPVSFCDAMCIIIRPNRPLFSFSLHIAQHSKNFPFPFLPNLNMY